MEHDKYDEDAMKQITLSYFNKACEEFVRTYEEASRFYEITTWITDKNNNSDIDRIQKGIKHDTNLYIQFSVSEKKTPKK